MNDWCTTGELHNSRFLLHDSGPTSMERIVIFATDMFSAIANEWYGNLSSNLFQQLYAIREKVREIFVTTVYCLLEQII